MAASPRFRYVGNVAVGAALPLAVLRPHYDAIVFAYGAAADKALHIPGETSLRGVHSAHAFVGWYNGQPDLAALDPALSDAEEAVVIGQGNVALDVARVLLSGVDRLRHTDMTEPALAALARSRVRRVRVVGRRGPLQAAFTIKELRELMQLPDVGFVPVDRALCPPEAVAALPRVQRRLAQALLKGSAMPPGEALREWELRFLLAPHAMVSRPEAPGRVAGVEFAHMAFQDAAAGTTSKTAMVARSGGTTTLPADVVFRSVGYQSAPLSNLFQDLRVRFDAKRGVIPSTLDGRVTAEALLRADGKPADNASHASLPRMYCTGWVQHGPSGVIARTMEDAFLCAQAIARDWSDSRNSHGASPLAGTGLGCDGVWTQALAAGLRPVSWHDWLRIDEAEQERGRPLGKPREKFTSVEDMLKVLDG